MAAAGFALMKSVYPQLTSEEAHRLIEEGLLTDDIGASGRDNETGYGLVNYRKMVETAFALRDQALSLPPDFRADPQIVDLGNIEVEETITISRLGSPAFSIAAIEVELLESTEEVADPSPISVDAQGFGTYRLAIDRDRFGPGEYQGQVSIRASNDEVKVLTLLFDVPVPSLEAETDRTRLFLQRALGGSFQNVDTVLFSGAGASFSLEAEEGTYRLLATTDMDGDFGICDAGELGGTFPGGSCTAEETFTVPDDTDGQSLELILRRSTN
jgi:serine protease